MPIVLAAVAGTAGDNEVRTVIGATGRFRDRVLDVPVRRQRALIFFCHSSARDGSQKGHQPSLQLP
jgi:hypothetical protein